MIIQEKSYDRKRGAASGFAWEHGAVAVGNRDRAPVADLLPVLLLLLLYASGPLHPVLAQAYSLFLGYRYVQYSRRAKKRMRFCYQLICTTG
jgi:hypothetical protein